MNEATGGRCKLTSSNGTSGVHNDPGNAGNVTYPGGSSWIINPEAYESSGSSGSKSGPRDWLAIDF